VLGSSEAPSPNAQYRRELGLSGHPCGANALVVGSAPSVRRTRQPFAVAAPYQRSRQAPCRCWWEHCRASGETWVMRSRQRAATSVSNPPSDARCGAVSTRGSARFCRRRRWSSCDLRPPGPMGCQPNPRQTRLPALAGGHDFFQTLSNMNGSSYRSIAFGPRLVRRGRLRGSASSRSGPSWRR
jgi:hypothetical protein